MIGEEIFTAGRSLVSLGLSLMVYASPSEVALDTESGSDAMVDALAFTITLRLGWRY